MNPNHPKKGSKIKVDPIRNMKDIRLIKKILSDNPRDLALFVIGINTNLRASDLLNIRIDQVSHLQVGDELVMKEQKTGKLRRITLNKPCVDVIRNLFRWYGDQNHDREWLFQSRKRKGKLTVPSVSRLVKRWCQNVNLKGNYAAHTLRKTWGYHQRVTYNADIPTLMVCFGHSTQRQTLDYLCVQPDEIKDIYMNEL